MFRIALFILCLFMCKVATAQFCGTDQESLMPYLDANLKSMVPHQRGAVKYVPVTFHMVAAANGNGRVEIENVLKQVANFNAQYADQEMIFYIDSLNSFDNDAVYNTPGSSAARTQMNIKKDKHSVNIFITNNADDGSGPGTTLAYYDPSGDWIVTRKNEVNGSASTLAHEAGHFFSLAHTHAGWDCVPYTTDDYTNPVNVNFTLPCEGGGGSLLIELHDRSNCATAGDKLCDTPEDYNLGLFYQPGCTQNTQIKDKNGEVIKPMITNFMSYYSGCATNEFTTSQKTLINTDYLSGRRSYIRTGHIPNTAPVTGPVNYITPINGEETPTLTNIRLDWDDVPNANRYLLIYDRFASFTFNPVKVIVYASEYTIPDALVDGTKYYWKVWPYNESQTNAMYSATQNFVAGTGVGINEISDVQDFSLSPNPVLDGSNAVLSLNSIKAFNAELKVVTVSGETVAHQAVEIPSGQSELVVQTEGLPAGVYFVMLSSKNGNLVERLMIGK